MKAALLPDRGVVKVTGDDARGFLNGLFTVDIVKLAPGTARFTALLTPQGKIVLDAFIAEAPAGIGGGFFLDVPGTLAVPCVERLNFYRMRARAMAENLSDTLGVMAAWDGDAATQYGLDFRDPRLNALGLRIILPPHLVPKAAAELGTELATAEDYEAHRIALGVPRGGLDFAYGDAFPHEADMDQLHGVDFTKGCFIGQEVVSRMEHRGIARRRTVPVAYDGALPEIGTAVMAGDKAIGTLGSSAAGRALALLRLDRAEEALAADHPLTAGGAKLRLIKPAWARFAFPGEHLRAT